jgi:hypothetical protein
LGVHRSQFAHHAHVNLSCAERKKGSGRLSSSRHRDDKSKVG